MSELINCYYIKLPILNCHYKLYDLLQNQNRNNIFM